MNRPSGLGRGLAALIPATSAPDEEAALALRELPVDDIVPNPRQPRGVFDDGELALLADSIASMGLLQPIVVRPHGGHWELIAGERRLRAARMAGLATIPAIVRGTDDDELLAEALVENVHRVQLNPIEEASAYAQLLDDFGITKEELARRLGRSRPTISNLLRLLSLPESVQRRVAAGVLTAGHAKALLMVPTADQQTQLADRIVREQLSVRATEELASLAAADGPVSDNGRQKGERPTPTREPLELPGVNELADTLTEALDAPVSIRVGQRRGRLSIGFDSAEALHRLVDVISRGLAEERREPA
ncbi:MAG: ParB/RepB/Spo0J family partition protein [Nitriliruptorales bacterium]|nr:ParB/RepB/Spo0J family partition protein [Nitriliruptorales bacterium]